MLKLLEPNCSSRSISQVVCAYSLKQFKRSRASINSKQSIQSACRLSKVFCNCFTSFSSCVLVLMRYNNRNSLCFICRTYNTTVFSVCQLVIRYQVNKNEADLWLISSKGCDIFPAPPATKQGIQAIKSRLLYQTKEIIKHILKHWSFLGQM